MSLCGQNIAKILKIFPDKLCSSNFVHALCVDYNAVWFNNILLMFGFEKYVAFCDLCLELPVFALHSHMKTVTGVGARTQ